MTTGSDKIKPDQVIEDDIFGPSKKSALEFIALLDRMRDGLTGLAKVNLKEIKASANPKDLETLEKLEQALKKNAELEQTLRDVQEKRGATIKKLTIDQAKLSEQRKADNKETIYQAKLALGLVTEYQKQSRTLNELRNSYKELELAGRANGVVGKGLLQVITEQDLKLKGLDATVGQHQRNVGNYAQSLVVAMKGMAGMVGLTELLGKAFGVDEETLTRMTEGMKTLIHTSRELNHVAHLRHLSHEENTEATIKETIATEGSTVAQEEQTAVEIESTAAKGLSLGMIGLIIAATAALAGGIWYLVTAQTRSLEELIKDTKEQNKNAEAVRKNKLERAGLQKDGLEKQNELLAKSGQITEREMQLRNQLIAFNLDAGKDEADREKEIEEEKVKYLEDKKNGLMGFQSGHDARMLEIQDRYDTRAKDKAKNYWTERHIIDLDNDIKDAEAMQERFDTMDKMQKAANDEWIKNTQDMRLKIRQLEVDLIADDNIRTIEDLKLKAKLQIEAVNKEVADEKVKAELIRLINEKLGKDIEDFNQKQYEKQQELDKKKIEDAQKLRQKDEDDAAEMRKKAEDARTKAEEEANKEREKNAKEHHDKMVADIIEAEKYVDDFIKKALDSRQKTKQEELNRETAQIDRSLSFQQDLFARNLDNQMAFENKRKAEQMVKQAALDKQARKQKEAQQLAELFLEAMKVYAKDGPAGFGKAVAMTFGAKSFEMAIAGSFKEGVEDFRGAGGPKDDANLIRFSNRESVVTAAGTADNPGLVTAMNEGGRSAVADWMINNIDLPAERAPRSADLVIASTIAAEIRSVKDLIKQRPASQFRKGSELGEIIEDKIQNGKRQEIHYKPRII